MRRILLAGKDLRLLDTRAAILKKTQSDVVCGGVEETLRCARQERFDLVVLCHTLDDGEAKAIAKVIRELSPRTKILMVVSDLSGDEFALDGAYPDGRFDAATPPEPELLITRATDLLESTPCLLD